MEKFQRHSVHQPRRTPSHLRHRLTAAARSWLCTSAIWLVLWGNASASGAQASIHGRVLSSDVQTPLSNAEVQIRSLRIVALTDSVGRFRIRDLFQGKYDVLVRAIGFAAESILVEVGANEVVVRDFLLHPAPQPLHEVEVIERLAKPPLPAKLSGFEERRKLGIGEFIDRNDLRKWEDRQTAVLLALVAGLDVRRAGNKAYAVTSRAAPPLTRVLRPPPCYMDVYIDGAALSPGAFDLNSINLRDVEAIEVYKSAAQMPPQYNKTSKGCGVILVWTR